MASTIKLERSARLAERFVRNAPLTFSGSTDPAFSNADWVRQFMLAPPFAWRWNRQTTTFTCVAGQQDYEVALNDFGWIERAAIKDPTTNAVIQELTVSTCLGDDSTSGQPIKIAAQEDDGAGKITFRLMSAPDKAYPVVVTYQKVAPTFSSMQGAWTPIPDSLSYLYNQGLLAKTYEYLGDERFGIAMQLFMRQVVAANEGLDETQINIFLSDRLNTDRQTRAEIDKQQTGIRGRGAL